MAEDGRVGRQMHAQRPQRRAAREPEIDRRTQHVEEPPAPAEELADGLVGVLQVAHGLRQGELVRAPLQLAAGAKFLDATTHRVERQLAGATQQEVAYLAARA